MSFRQNHIFFLFVAILGFAMHVANGQRVVRSGGAPKVGISASSLWRDPTFQKELIGSFGINPEIEPGFTEEERQYHDRIVSLLSDDPDQAIELLESVLEVDGVSARFDFLLATILFQNDDRSGAVQNYRRAIEKFPDYRDAHKNLATIYVQQGSNEPAIQHFTRAIELGASSSLMYGLLGFANIATEDFLAAESAFRTALLLGAAGSQSNNWKLGLVQSLFSQEKYAEVVSMLDSMIAARPDDERLWDIQANGFIGTEEFLEASKNLEIMDALGYSTEETLKKAADIYVNQGLFDMAANTYLKIYENDSSGDVDGPLKAAEVLMERDGVDQARRLINEVRATAGAEFSKESEGKLLRLEAQISMSQEEMDDAAKLLMRVIEIDPLDGKSLIMLGDIYRDEGQIEKAAFQYERAAGISEFEADAKVQHGQLLAFDGKYEQAIPLLRRAQELNPRESVGQFLEDIEDFVKRRR
ncbi:MAG: tetratricopeptide repeat protein [Verrucomicrobiota bacterium]